MYSVHVCTVHIYVIYRPRDPDKEILARGHVNNVFIFFCAILNPIHTKFQCCELALRSVFVTLLQVRLTNSQEDMTKKLNLVLIAVKFDCNERYYYIKPD